MKKTQHLEEVLMMGTGVILFVIVTFITIEYIVSMLQALFNSSPLLSKY